MFQLRDKVMSIYTSRFAPKRIEYFTSRTLSSRLSVATMRFKVSMTEIENVKNYYNEEIEHFK